jgi:hypothetical protein
MKMIMKEQTNKANNLLLGAIYINANTGTPCRLVHIVPCEGAWLESYDGQGYGDTVKFEDVHYADADEVEDFLADYRVYNASEKAPSFKDDSPAIYPSDRGYHKPERQVDVNGDVYVREDEDYLCRD